MGERKGSDREHGSSWQRQQNSWRLLCAGATLMCLVAFASLNERQQGRGFPCWRRGGGGGGSAVHAPSSAWLPPTGRPVDADSHPPSMHPSTPSQAMFEAMQAAPTAAARAAVLEEFAAAPWLLPPRTPALPYAGVHRLDELMALRAASAGRHSRTVTIVLFGKAYATMAQNSIYSLVKHGGVRNYLAVTWSSEDFEACLDLNLPCADVSDMLIEPPVGTSSHMPQHDFVVMSWTKPAVVLRALRQGYAIMVVDTDVAYAVKPLWESYLELIDQYNADGAWQTENPINSGHFVLLPTNASRAFAEAWVAAGPASLLQRVTDQKYLPELERSHFVGCRSLCLCYRHKFKLIEQGRRDQVALFALYWPSHLPYTHAGCTVGSAAWMPLVDPCDWGVLYVHPICAKGAAAKEAALRAVRFWFMDREQGCSVQPGAISGVPACRPLHWRQPDVEAAHYSCPSFGLGLVHGRLSAAAQALRDGASGDEGKRLLRLSADKTCTGRGKGRI